MTEPYSPLRYPGGKARLTPFIVQVIRDNGLLEPDYVEPYAGGAGAALRLLFEEYVDFITINDADPSIRCFWQSVTKHTSRFLDLLEISPVTVPEWRRQRAIYEKRDLRKVVELGFATFFLNRTSRSGIIHNGGPIGGYEQTGNYKIDARFNREKLARRIERIGAYADRIHVSCVDGLALLQDIAKDVSRAKKTFLYLDPPYYAQGAALYMNRFCHKEHAGLAEFLKSGPDFPWILTYDDVPEIRQLYQELPQKSFRLSYSAYDRRTGQELLVRPDAVNISSRALEALPAVCELTR